MIGIQLLNPIENRSTEQITIHDSQYIDPSRDVWHLKRDLAVFPVTSSSFAVVMEYDSGANALGGAVMVITALRAPIQVYKKFGTWGGFEANFLILKTRIRVFVRL